MGLPFEFETMSPPVRDHTQEFLATVDSFQQHFSSKSPSLSENVIANLPKISIEQSSQIRNLANQSAESMEEVKQKIVELELLSKSTSNFRDERPKIAKLMMSIKTDIQNIGNDLATMSSFILQSFNGISPSHHCISHHKALLNLLQSRYEKLAKSFASACDLSTKYLKKQKKQREEFGFGANKKKRTYRKVPINRLQQRRRQHSNDSEAKPLLSSQQSQMTLYNETQYTQQRAMEAEKIELATTEIAQMMSKLATIVHNQRETIITISDNVEDATQNVEGAIDELQKYLASLTGNRWLMIKVFALLIFLAIIFTVFIA